MTLRGIKTIKINLSINNQRVFNLSAKNISSCKDYESQPCTVPNDIFSDICLSKTDTTVLIKEGTLIFYNHKLLLTKYFKILKTTFVSLL